MIMRLTALCSLIAAASSNRKLLLVNVNVITRNGMSAPRSDLVDLSPESLVGTSSFDSLLPAGKRQMYILGKHLAKNYSYLLSNINRQANVTLRAINSLPTLMSAWSLSAGLLPDNFIVGEELPSKAAPLFKKKTVKHEFTSALPAGWDINKISISKLDKIDFLFNLSSKNSCPNINTVQVKKVIEEMNEKFSFEDSYQKVATALKFNPESHNLKNVTKLYLASRLFEILESKLSVDSTFHITKETKEYQDLKKSHSAYIFSTVSIENSLKLLNSPLGMTLLGNMNKSILADRFKSGDPRSFSVFIGHDKFFLAFLHFLGLYKSHCAFGPYLKNSQPQSSCVDFPDPGSSIQIELYKEVFDDEEENFFPDYYVKIHYNGAQVGLGTKDPPLDNLGFTPWKDFRDYMKDHIYRDWDLECGLGGVYIEPSRSNWIMLMVMINLLLFLFLGVVMYWFYNRKESLSPPERKNSDRLSQVLNEHNLAT